MFSQLVSRDEGWRMRTLQQLDAYSRDLTPREPCGVCFASSVSESEKAVIPKLNEMCQIGT